MKLKYDIVEMGGSPARLYYYKELSTEHLKAYIFSRFATFSIPFISTGDRNKDRRLARETVEEMGYDWAALQKGHHIHHHPLGHKLEWIPKEIHMIPHRGGVSIVNKRA